MNPEWKTKWVEALRSEKYKQGKNMLKTICEGEYKYCCLGVLCELQNQDFEVDFIKSNSYHIDNVNSKRDYSQGLNSTMCAVLAHMNDKENKSFEEIADYIEKNL